jgi:spore coat polysaccharide biosynthesis protein SpsF
MRTVAIIQARMGSTRLPGKVLKVLGDRSVLAHVITRVRAVAAVDEVVVATTELVADDAILEAAVAAGAKVFRGSESDVLSRYYHAAIAFDAELVVRVTSDCPLFDSELLARMLQRFDRLREDGAAVDYLSNTLERTYPRGLDAEIFTMEVLAAAFAEARSGDEREHVTPFVYLRPDRFALRGFTAAIDHSRHRWTLDTSEDWQLIEAIFRELYVAGAPFGTERVLDFLAVHPELVALNADVEQKRLATSP